MYIDTHAHLTYDSYDLKKVTDEYEINGVKKIINAGYDLDSSLWGERLANEYESIYFAVGVHPADSKQVDEKNIDIFKKLSTHKKCVAIGEIGLDYHYDNTDKIDQKRAFIRQIELANELQLPIIIHSRDDVEDMQEILKANRNLLLNGGVMHCYSHSKECMKTFLDLGLYISFAGPITFKNAKKEDVISYTPDDRILAETDCPYLTPEPFRGKQNEPKNVVYVTKKIAQVKNKSTEEMKKIIWKNAHTLFKKLNGD